MRKPDSSNDRRVMSKHVPFYPSRQVMSKHAAIYPSEEELQLVMGIVSACEKALRLVSDMLAETDSSVKVTPQKQVKPSAPKKDTAATAQDSTMEVDTTDNDKDDLSVPRLLKGVMRVGLLAKGLLLRGDLSVNLILLCSEKPTRSLLKRVADCLPKQMAINDPDGATDEKYTVKCCVEEAAIIVTSTVEPHVTCTITLTSQVMRETDSSTVKVKDPPGVLDRQKCLDALTALRHAKWFQYKATGLQSCVIVIRILRDLCRRVPVWTPLNEWAMELLVEKSISSGGDDMNPGDALRRVFECIAAGVLHLDGPGVLDPCEKEPVDAASGLSIQEREEITASAQHALRLIAFKQVHKVLGMEPLPVPHYQRRSFYSRKRRHVESAAGDGETDGNAEKKEKSEKEVIEAI